MGDSIKNLIWKVEDGIKEEMVSKKIGKSEHQERRD
jgi:hypothetical protein